MLALDEARESLVQASQLLSSKGLLFRGEHANLSARVGENEFVMTQGGSVAHLTVQDFSRLDTSGRILEGNMDPTMQEVIQMHAGVYRSRESVGSVIHTHAPHMTAFAVAHQEIPLIYEPLLRFGVTEPIPVVPWAPRGSDASVNGILDLVQHHPGLPSVMLANHGVLVFHQDPMNTARLLATLDEAAELVIMASAIGGAKSLNAQAVDAVRERMNAFQSSR